MPRTTQEYAANYSNASLQIVDENGTMKALTYFQLNTGAQETASDSLADLVTAEVISEQEKTDLLATLGKIRAAQGLARNLDPPT